MMLLLYIMKQNNDVLIISHGRRIIMFLFYIMKQSNHVLIISHGSRTVTSIFYNMAEEQSSYSRSIPFLHYSVNVYSILTCPII